MIRKLCAFGVLRCFRLTVWRFMVGQHGVKEPLWNFVMCAYISQDPKTFVAASLSPKP